MRPPGHPRSLECRDRERRSETRPRPGQYLGERPMPRPPHLTRREFVRTGTAIAAAAVLDGPVIHVARRAAGAGPSFQRALPIPPVLAPVRRDATTDYYEI